MISIDPTSALVTALLVFVGTRIVNYFKYAKVCLYVSIYSTTPYRLRENRTPSWYSLARDPDLCTWSVISYRTLQPRIELAMGVEKRR